MAEIRHSTCSRRSEVIIDYSAALSLERAARAAYREKHGILPAAAIRSVRESRSLDEASSARLVRIDPTLLRRWEHDEAVPTAQADVVIRLARDVPASLEYLRRLAA